MIAATQFQADPLVHELLARRRSPRAIDPNRRVSKLAIGTLLEAALIAPSSFNEQPWRFLVFDGVDPEALEEARSCLVTGNAWARAAPLLLLSVAAERWQKDGSFNRHSDHVEVLWFTRSTRRGEHEEHRTQYDRIELPHSHGRPEADDVIDDDSETVVAIPTQSQTGAAAKAAHFIAGPC